MSLVTTSRRPLWVFVLVTALVGCQEEPDEMTKARARLAALAAAYDIDIVEGEPLFHSGAHGRIECKWPTDQALESYIPLFLEEFALYPVDVVKRCKLERIVLGAELTNSDGKRVTGLADYEHNALFLDITSNADERGLRGSIHHEVFHFIDYVDDGHEDEEWCALNLEGFEYGHKRWGVMVEHMAPLTGGFAGFLSSYATTGVEEDKAVVFSTLIVDPSRIEEVAIKDVVTRAKVERMRKSLVAFCPELNESFWKRARKVTR